MTSLLERLRQGEHGAFKAIFDRHWEQVYAVCHQGTRSADLAKEMTQEIFISLWERRKELDISVPLDHYLRRAGRYRIFNHYRDRCNRERLRERANGPKQGAEAENPEGPGERAAYLQFAGRVRGLVEALPHRCRAVFRMSSEEELSHAEIAETLSITVKAVEYHARNARERLKKALRENPS